ncbi:efflux RND transporter periplasmic adaptor subunit [Lutibacter sp. A64]|uniref:efflux RND transporter periplasmic adaptor subunit n=1 Tax=Lutibacter sp. A64 TaxID=2918526 RepID=UPI001F058BEA|nr:efflux RND transporter periplasmic adaptor subunit [Lutibacter sp. A64]UMB54436.1 efflux RND transporter periplasmic adaptor subunit [Lutibacter sp. A64]
MKNIFKILTIITLTIVISCGKDNVKVVDNRVAVNVKVSTPSSEVGTFITASGKVEATQNANLSTRNMGYVNKVHVNVGDKVSKGQLLLSINSADILAQKAQVGASIAEATAAFKSAEKDYNRFKVLFSSNSASQKEMDDITANYEMAKARLEATNQMKNQVNAQLSYSNITAPFSGVITGKFINAGDMANPGMPLISIENPGKFQVIAMVPESEITSIKNGTTVDVLIKSINKILKGTITEVSSSTKNTGGQYLVKIVLEETDVKLLSGMFASVQFPTEKTARENTPILIPTSSIIERGELRGVYVVSQSNTALLRWLRLGKEFGDKTEVLSGLSAEDRFVLTSESKIVNGSKLNVQ